MESAFDGNDIEDIEANERKHFQNVINAFRNYKSYSLRKLYKSTKYITTLPLRQQELLKGYRIHLHKIRTSIEHNFEVIKLILQDVPHMFENKDHTEELKSQNIQVSQYDMEKVQGIFKQILREWSAEGKTERDASFQPILDEITQRFPENRRDVRVLVPGAGLGRLAYEIAKQGFSSQGNEFSLFMLFVSNFILNKCKGCNMYNVYPWVSISCNHLNSDDQVRSINFPDVNPSEITNSEFSMAAGNFIEIYNIADSWDCVATCFFLDTANNIIDYIEIIWNILKPGGYWINVGPLLYHHADLPNQDSIEPSYEEIRHIIRKTGFVYLKEETDLSTPYCENPKSMLRYEYKSVFFVCKKLASC